MKRAFTFIQLLSVIAILTIIASLFIAVFACPLHEVDDSRSTRDHGFGNIKKLALAYALYVEDTGGVYFAAGQDVTNGAKPTTSLNWNGYLQPYLKSPWYAVESNSYQVVPSYGGANFTGLTMNTVDICQLSIGMNVYFTPVFTYGCSIDFSSALTACSTYVKESQFQFPAQQALFASSWPSLHRPLGMGFWVSPYHNVDGPSGLSDRHHGSSNVSFTDTHAKLIRTRTMLVADQVVELTPDSSGQCVNYDVAQVYWDPTAPLPTDQPLCEGHTIR